MATLSECLHEFQSTPPVDIKHLSPSSFHPSILHHCFSCTHGPLAAPVGLSSSVGEATAHPGQVATQVYFLSLRCDSSAPDELLSRNPVNLMPVSRLTGALRFKVPGQKILPAVVGPAGNVCFLYIRLKRGKNNQPKQNCSYLEAIWLN